MRKIPRTTNNLSYFTRAMSESTALVDASTVNRVVHGVAAVIDRAFDAGIQALRVQEQERTKRALIWCVGIVAFLVFLYFVTRPRY